MQLLRAELWEMKQQVQTIHEEKEALEAQKRRLQEERNQLAREREEHVAHVVSAHLGDIWLFGVKTLGAHRKVAKVARKLTDEGEKVKPYREWKKGLKGPRMEALWFRSFPDPGEIGNESRNEWGELLLVWSGQWQCSKDYSYTYESSRKIELDPQGSKPGTEERAARVAEWQEDVQVERRRREAEYHVLCFDELEAAVRQRIEAVDGQVALSIRDFAKRLLQWPGIKDASREVTVRLRRKLMKEISSNRQLGNLAIQLRVAPGSSLEEIAEEARHVMSNLDLARDWLDEATEDRRLWSG